MIWPTWAIGLPVGWQVCDHRLFWFCLVANIGAGTLTIDPNGVLIDNISVGSPPEIKWEIAGQGPARGGRIERGSVRKTNCGTIPITSLNDHLRAELAAS